MFPNASFSISDPFYCSAGYIDHSFLTVIDSIFLVLLFFTIWILPLYVFRKKGLLIKFFWIFVWGFILNFHISITDILVSSSDSSCFQGKNTDIINLFESFLFFIGNIYGMFIQPLLLILIVILLSITIIKFCSKKMKMYLSKKS